ncbi:MULTISPECIES: hypothetical protein [unclassified Pseudomonas]|nr:hypothetical protein [Pseudomonas sp. CFBP 8772]MBD8597037.1 hypothetical protein [Pseudomonas sp. CFBP 8772]RZI66791.1 MAG: DUF1427 family protein [Pseudomonas sp.]
MPAPLTLWSSLNAVAPLLAVVGLLGMQAGEWLWPVGKQFFSHLAS